MIKTIINLTLLVSFILLVSSCGGTRYGRLTTRVKSKPPAEKAENRGQRFPERVLELKPVTKEIEITNNTHHPPINVLEFEVISDQETAVVSAENEKTSNNTATFGKDEYHQPKDTIVSGDSDIEFRKAQYEKANRLAKLGLGFTIGLLVPAIGFFLFVFGYITTIRAFSIYRRYKNPGVEEKFEMAKWTFIISTILIVVGLLVGVYVFLLFF
jgi:hypothetical protein